jgi:hypothetical protein
MGNIFKERFYRWRNDPVRRLRSHFAGQRTVTAVRVGDGDVGEDPISDQLSVTGAWAGLSWETIPLSPPSMRDFIDRQKKKPVDLVYFPRLGGDWGTVKQVVDDPAAPSSLLVEPGRLAFDKITDGMNLLTKQYEVEDLGRYWFCTRRRE